MDQVVVCKTAALVVVRKSISLSISKMRIVNVILIAIFLCSCTSSKLTKHTTKADAAAIPLVLKGSFTDDYGIRYTINDTVWTQHPNVKYHIIKSDTLAQYLLAKNDISNPSERELYTRIDYMQFTNMEPYHWGFCLTVYNAKTVEEAQNKTTADRGNPRKGCNGYPFSRMKKSE
jgi:hypothetical protein